MEPEQLVSLALTNVHYNPHDPISYVCAWLALVPQGLCIVYASLIWSTREIEIALTFIGQLACEGLNWALKRYFKQARPELIRHLHKGYGMPSSHAQFVSYFAVTVTLFVFLRHSPSIRAIESANGASSGRAQRRKKSEVVVVNGLEKPLFSEDDDSTTPPISPAYRLQLHHPRLTHTLLSLFVLGLAASVALSRVYLHYHTVNQILVGSGTGAVFAVAWFAATEAVRRIGLIEWILDLDLVRKTRVRDLICEEDLVEIGWQVWEERRQRSKKSHHSTKKLKQ